jgi:hypothetical protein
MSPALACVPLLLTPAHHWPRRKKDLADLDEQIRKVKDSQSALAKIQQDYNKSPRLTYLNTFMDQADITAKNIELTDS